MYSICTIFVISLEVHLTGLQGVPARVLLWCEGIRAYPMREMHQSGYA